RTETSGERTKPGKPGRKQGSRAGAAPWLLSAAGPELAGALLRFLLLSFGCFRILFAFGGTGLFGRLFAVERADDHLHVERIGLRPTFADVHSADGDRIAGLSNILHELGNLEHAHVAQGDLRRTLGETLAMGYLGLILRFGDFDIVSLRDPRKKAG